MTHLVFFSKSFLMIILVRFYYKQKYTRGYSNLAKKKCNLFDEICTFAFLKKSLGNDYLLIINYK